MEQQDHLSPARSFSALSNSTVSSTQDYAKLFDYYLAMDIEATWGDQRNVNELETVELSCVLVDVQTRRSVAEFQRYVRPTRQPVLPAYCSALTGISQATIDRAPTFKSAFLDFLDWLDKGNLGDAAPKKSFAVVTCGDRCLRKLLPNQFAFSLEEEALRERLEAATEEAGSEQRPVLPASLPRFLTRWLNIKGVFSQHIFADRHIPRDITEMLLALGLPHIGRDHSGIDDCRNLAAILAECLRRGYTLDCTTPDGVASEKWFGDPHPPPPTSVSDVAPKPPAPFGIIKDSNLLPQRRDAQRAAASGSLGPSVIPDLSHADPLREVLDTPPLVGPEGKRLTRPEAIGMSKKIASLLLHAAPDEGLPMSCNGFVPVQALLEHRSLGRRVSVRMLAELVANSDQRRFAFAFDAFGCLYIRATHGHSIPGLHLEP